MSTPVLVAIFYRVDTKEVVVQLTDGETNQTLAAHMPMEAAQLFTDSLQITIATIRKETGLFLGPSEIN